MQMCPDKERPSSNYCTPGILEGHKKKPRQNKKKKKNYLTVNYMTVIKI